MKAILSLLLCSILSSFLFSQSNIQQSLSVNGTGNAADASAQLDVSATDKGVLVPRMTTVQRSAITAANALLVFDTDTRSFWFFDSPAAAWREIRSGNIASLQDADGDTKVQVEESPDEDIIRFDLGGTENLVLRKNFFGAPRLELTGATPGNTFVGEAAGNASSTSYGNTALGIRALHLNTDRSNLVALGDSALFHNGTDAAFSFHSEKNTAVGSKALFSNSVGYSNTATGFEALYLNTSGYSNTATGRETLRFNTTGHSNTATGRDALYFNMAGNNNTATGSGALYGNTTGNNNTASGDSALNGNSSGNSNTAMGRSALALNNSGSNNTAVGMTALFGNFTGSNNTALGHSANVLSGNLSNATAIGYNARVNCSNCFVLGGTGADSVKVGIGLTNPASRLHVFSHENLTIALGESNTGEGIGSRRLPGGNLWGLDFYTGSSVRMSIANNGFVGIGRLPVSNRFEVEGNASKSSAGDWLANSDARLKKNISPLNSQEMLQKLLALQGVTYEWDDDQTGSTRPEGVQFGFVAQNIRAVFPTLVEEDQLGFLQTAYGTYDAMTVEAIRALNEEIEILKMEIGRLKGVETAHADLKSQLDKITAALAGAGIAVEK